MIVAIAVAMEVPALEQGGATDDIEAQRALPLPVAVPALKQGGATDDMEAQPSILLIKKIIKKGLEG
jgi:hypothetical protein